MTNIITIDGQIGEDMLGMGVTFNSIRSQVIQDSQDIEVHINSVGGDVNEGFAIHDYLKSLGKPITTVVIGKCYSIATIILLAGDKRLMYPHSEIMIHNPWGMAQGDADELEKYANWVREKEEQIVDFYYKITNIKKSELRDMMDQQTFMGYDQAKAKGFITGQVQEMKAVALLNIKNNDMKELSEEEKNWFQKKFDKIESFFTNQPKAEEEPKEEKEDEPSEIDQLKAKLADMETAHAAEVDALKAEFEVKLQEKEAVVAEQSKQFAEVQASLNELKTAVFGQEPPKQTKQVQFNQPANQFSNMYEALKNR